MSEKQGGVTIEDIARAASNSERSLWEAAIFSWAEVAGVVTEGKSAGQVLKDMALLIKKLTPRND